MQAAYPPALRQATQWPAGQQECLRLLRDRAGIIGFAQDANAYVQPVPAEHFSDLTRLLPVEPAMSVQCSTSVAWNAARG